MTATGLNLQAFGGIPLTVDDAPVSIPETVTYKGMMLTGVPNLAFAIGYTNSSWTLKVGLLCEHFCRLLSHMDENGYDACVPQLPDDSENAARRPFLDFSAGYIQRSVADLPRQGESEPWVTSMSYHADVKLLRADAVEDNGLRFSTHKLATTPADPVAATSPLA